MKRVHILLAVISLAALLLPATLNVYESIRLDDWRISPRFDGQAYVLSDEPYVQQEVDSTGVAAVLATLLSWGASPTTEIEVHERLLEADFRFRLSNFVDELGTHGFEGHWLQADTPALNQLKLPYIAHVADGGGRLVIVRDARNGYIYAADPLRGNVLYPVENFAATWTGQVFAFPDPPLQPEEWR